MKFLAVFSLAVAITSAIPLGVTVDGVVSLGGTKTENKASNAGSGCKASAKPQATQSNGICPDGLYGRPQCCATNVLGVADLDCVSADGHTGSVDDLKNFCHEDSRKAMCCQIPIAGQALLCREID